MKITLPTEQMDMSLYMVVKEVCKKGRTLNVWCTHPDGPSVNISAGSPLTTKVDFIDPRFPHMEELATLTYITQDEKPKYEVYSKNIRNEKYRGNSYEYHTKKTTNPMSAVKTLLDVCRPYAYSDVARNNFGELKKVIYAWRHEYSDVIRKRLGYTGYFDADDIIKEIAHMKTLGLSFCTDMFRSLAEETYPAYVETKRRESILLERYHVYVFEDGKVAVSSVPEGEETIRDNVVGETHLYDNIDSIPENLLGKIALLKMLDDGKKEMPTVGVRTLENEFYLMGDIPT